MEFWQQIAYIVLGSVITLVAGLLLKMSEEVFAKIGKVFAFVSYFAEDAKVISMTIEFHNEKNIPFVVGNLSLFYEDKDGTLVELVQAMSETSRRDGETIVNYFGNDQFYSFFLPPNFMKCFRLKYFNENSQIDVCRLVLGFTNTKNKLILIRINPNCASSRAYINLLQRSDISSPRIKYRSKGHVSLTK
jgi:hypothetical protein